MTGVQTCALPISALADARSNPLAIISHCGGNGRATVVASGAGLTALSAPWPISGEHRVRFDPYVPNSASIENPDVVLARVMNPKHLEFRTSGHGKGPEIGQGADSTASPAPDAATVARPLPPQWLMIASGLLRAVVALVPLSLIVAGLAWILHRTSVPTIQPSG